MLRKILTAAFAMAMSAQTFAGVTISGGDFSSATDSAGQVLDTVTGEFTAWGLLSTNTTSGSLNCVSCELTFVAEGYVLDAGASAAPNAGLNYYTGGTMTVYLDDSADYVELNAANTNAAASLASAGADADTEEWLVLQGVADIQGYTFTGLNLFTLLTGGGLLEVIGGTEAIRFDTNTQFGGADLNYSATFTDNEILGGLIVSAGAGTFTGNAIPEPASIALMGLGLLGFAGVARRRKA